MTKAALAALVAVLLCGVGLAGAASTGKPRTVTRACFGVQGGVAPSRYDLNVYGQNGRVCIVGRKGKNGRNGKAGARGQDGAGGAEGARGAQGVPGVPGVQGDKGEQGWQGVQGPAGEHGANGAQGPVGATGAPGPTGATGPTGPAGADGHNGLGDGTATLCVSNGENVKYGGQNGELCDAGHDLILHVVIVEQAAQ